MEERRYISSETAAQLIGITRRSVNRQIKGGRLQAVATPTTKGGAEGTANSILLEDVLQQLDTQGRLLWYESQSGLSTQVSAADLATYKEAFGEEGLTRAGKSPAGSHGAGRHPEQRRAGQDGGDGRAGGDAGCDEPDAATLARGIQGARAGGDHGQGGAQGQGAEPDVLPVGAGLHRGADVRQSEVSADAGAGAPAGTGLRNTAKTPATAACTATDRTRGGRSDRQTGRNTPSAPWQAAR